MGDCDKDQPPPYAPGANPPQAAYPPQQYPLQVLCLAFK